MTSGDKSSQCESWNCWLASHTCLMWITDSAGADKQKTSTMNTLTMQALLSCRATSAHCPPPLVTAAPWAPDESEQRQLTDRVGEFTTAGHLWPRDDQSTSSHSLIAGRLISSFEPGVSSARTPNMSFPGPKIKPTTYSSAASSKCLCAPSTCLLQLPDNLLTFSLLTSNWLRYWHSPCLHSISHLYIFLRSFSDKIKAEINMT